MKREIKNLRILLTGGSGGIGRTLATMLVQNGAKVCNFARRKEELEGWQNELAKSFVKQSDDIGDISANAAIFVGDVIKVEDRAAVIDSVVERWGGLDCVINNAGVGAIGRFAEAKPETLRQLFEVNFFAAVELTRVALPHLIKGASPIVVNIGSILGHRAVPQYSEYCASKFALRGWSESLRSELTASGIDLLVVSPGTTESDFYKNTLGELHTPPWKNPAPVPNSVVAQKILNAMRKGKREIIPSTNGRWLVWANRLFPGIIDRVMSKWG